MNSGKFEAVNSANEQLTVAIESNRHCFGHWQSSFCCTFSTEQSCHHELHGKFSSTTDQAQILGEKDKGSMTNRVC